MAGFAALFAVPSPTSASPVLTHPTGTAAPVGTTFIATNVAHANTPQVFRTTTSLGNMECAAATVTGEIVKNDGTDLVGTISTFELKGTPSSPSTSHCGGGFSGNVSVTPNHTSNPTHNGVASLPWCITAAKEDVFTIFGEAGGSCTSGQTRPITIVYDSTVIGACTYEKAQVSGTYTTHPADAILTISGQKFTKITGSGFCPATFEIHLALTLTTDVSGAEGAAVYIS